MTHTNDPSSTPEVGATYGLFRQEAVEAASSRFGAPVKALGVAAWALTIFMVLLLVVAVIFLSVSRYTRKETVTGVIQPTAGAARIAALGPGIVSEVYVTEGQAVRAGQPVLSISADPTVANGEAQAGLSGLVQEGAQREATAMVDRARAQNQIAMVALEDAQSRRAGLQHDQVELAQSVALQEERVRLARETLEAGKLLHDRQLFSTLQLRQREEALIVAQQGLATIRRDRRRTETSLRQLAVEEGRLRAQAADAAAGIALTQAQFDQRQAQRLAERSVLLLAPKAGNVAALQARAGSPVQPGRALAVILPANARLRAELWVPSRAAGFIQPGTPVRLMYDAFPYQKFGIGRGRVTSISGAPVDPGDLTVPIETSEALYRVLVEIDGEAVDGYGRARRLTPGMRLSADLLLDDRSLWEWLFDPIIAAGRRAGR